MPESDTGRDIAPYWMAYSDLLGLRVTLAWPDEELRAHHANFGAAEGRRIGRPADIPPDWSDWLYFTDWRDELSWWWRQGALPTGAYSALVGTHGELAFGCISRNPRLRDNTRMSPEARLQLHAHARDFPGSGPLRELGHGPLRWGPQETGHALPLADLVRRRFPAGADQMILLPWLQFGGAERVGIWHHEAAEAAGLVSVLVTADDPEQSVHHARHADRVLNLPALLRDEFGADFATLGPQTRIGILAEVVAALRPGVLHLIHSYTGYAALADPLAGPRLRAAAGRIHVSAFCPHIYPNGAYDGYFRFIPDICHFVDRFVFDNSWYRDEIAGRYALPAAQATVLRYPVERIEPVDPGRTGAGNRVLWASRLDAQKNPGIVARIARRLPMLEFHLWGSEVLGDTAIDWAAMPPNVRRCGPFAAPSELPLDEVIAFLYTSRFDGMPNILLEVGARGVPIVTPRVGGVADYLGETWMFYTGDPDDLESYVAHLAMLHRSPELRRFAGERLIATARAERSVAAFRAAVAPLLPAHRAAASAGGGA
jgi:glycosyltransferase involved in cell wall biosynthesis